MSWPAPAHLPWPPPPPPDLGHKVEVKPWSRSEIEVRSKWQRSEIEVTSKYNDTMTSKYSDNRPITMICRRTSSADNARGGWSEVVKWGGVAGWRECVSGYLLNPLNPYWTTERKTQEPHKAQHNTTRCCYTNYWLGNTKNWCPKNVCSYADIVQPPQLTINGFNGL